MKKIICVLILVVSLILTNGGIIYAGMDGNSAYASGNGNTRQCAYDNRIKDSDPNVVYADRNYLDVGQVLGCSIYRAFLWFDLSGYTDVERISKATISLSWYFPTTEQNARVNDTILEVYRPKSWKPEYVSWNKRNRGASWKNPGGDWFDANGHKQGNVPYATVTLGLDVSADGSYYELDVTELVKEYVSGENNNTGFFIKTKYEYGDYVSLRSLEYAEESQRPKLTVEYNQ